MKTTKKLLAVLLALVMALALSVTAFAEQEGPLTGGSITIYNAVPEETYSIYQIAYVESYDVNNNRYAYKANSVWRDFLEDSAYVDVTDDGYVSWNLNEGETQPAATDVAQFAKEALAYAQTMVGEPGSEHVQINPDAFKTAESNSLTFSHLNLGWYLVDTSLGSLCSLDTTKPMAEIREKNTTPSIDKKVSETGNANTWVDEETVDAVENSVHYQLTVTVGAGVDGNYTITDVLPEEVTYIYPENGSPTDGLTVTGLSNGDYSATYSNNQLVITLDGDALAVTTGSTVTITYSASVSGLKVGAIYTNTATLTYKAQTDSDTASIRTYQIDGSAEGNTFTKVDGSNQSPMEGVKFVLQNKSTGEYATFGQDGYLTGWVNTQAQATKLSTDRNGHIHAYGLDADTYVLTETDTLDGYNLLADTITVTIAENGTVTYNGEGASSDGTTITVENNSGTLLPTTGGMGTTVLYLVGAILVVGAGVVLVVRRRMNADQ